MRKIGSYLGVFVIGIVLTWWIAGMRLVTLPAAPPEAPNTPIELTPEEQISVAIYQNVNRSVVNITTRSIAQDDWGLSSEAVEGSGSGSVLDKKGHIVTNYHVIEDARQISVTLFDGSSHDARLIGFDKNNDIAVLRIDAPADKLFPITWGDSTRLLVGMRVYAIGNPFGLERTLTTGIISSLNRSMRSENQRLIKGVIQTDAAINPGNSGGPLLNRQGHMIGITTAIIGRARQSAGIGLAIPSNPAKRAVEEIINHGRVLHGDAGINSVFQTDRGLLISRLETDGPAAKAGLRGPQIRIVQRNGYSYRVPDRSKADLIVSVDGQDIRSVDDLLEAVESKRPGDKVTFHIIRNGKPMDVIVELGEASE